MVTKASSKQPKVKPASKLKIDMSSAYDDVLDSGQETADVRFETATRLLEKQPSPFHVIQDQPDELNVAGQFDPSKCKVGTVYAVPIHLVDPNPFGARHFYRMENVEAIVQSFTKSSQDVAANGYIKGNRVELIDGGTRLRAARSCGYMTLDVKIEEPPISPREQFKRSTKLNDIRSDSNALDMAMSMKTMIKLGVYATQEEMGRDMTDRKGDPLSESQVSAYMRIAKIPERLLAKMSEKPRTSYLTIAHEVSALFVLEDYKNNPEKYMKIADDIIDEINAKGLSKSQTQQLVASAITGPKTRRSAQTLDVNFENKVGKLKIFPVTGQIQLSINGLSDSQLNDVRERLQKALAIQLSL